LKIDAFKMPSPMTTPEMSIGTIAAGSVRIAELICCVDNRVDPEQTEHTDQPSITMHLDTERSHVSGIIMESELTCLSKFINDSGKYECLRGASMDFCE